MSAPAHSEPGGLHLTLAETWTALAASPAGLGSAEAAGRLRHYGPNRLGSDEGTHPIAILFRQFRSPMVLILLGAAGLSFALGETTEAIIVTIIVVASSGLGFYQEYRAGNAVAALRKRIGVASTVLRDGEKKSVPAAELVPGDIVLLAAGSLVQADAVLIEASAFQADEAALTGESFPLAKLAVARDAPIGDDNRVHMGTSVRSGEGTALVVETGSHTEFGKIAALVARLEPETSFARGIRRFGLLMTQIMLLMVTLVIVANVLLGRPVLDSLLFAAALAVGLTPELLPAIVTVTLAQGAKRLTGHGVLVRRLVAIENLGAMDVLCTDKTGTLTEGEVHLERALDAGAKASDETLEWAVVNAGLQTAMPNPLDTAILAAGSTIDLGRFRKRGEVPYDFDRRRLSVLVETGDGVTLVCKGSVASVLPVCSAVWVGTSDAPMTPARRAVEESRLAGWSGKGFRVLAVATRKMDGATACVPADETGLTLVGYLLFSDPLKADIHKTVAALEHNGIQLKILTGDNRYVAAHIAEAAGLAHLKLVTGEALHGLSDRSLAQVARRTDVFAEVTPDQKERIITALRRAGRTVGYLGDGINDAPALRAADIGISVDSAVDAAKAAADVVLLQRDLSVLLDGVIAGRTAFGNTIKYIAITISANLGNMISMAVASLFLPFLPLLATQILLNNALSDLPMLAISTDRVDAEVLASPRRWDFSALLRSMLAFGLLSSLFDGITFAVLLGVFHANEALFQTAWFVESLLTELAIVAVMRTHKSFFTSLPSSLLIGTSIAVAAVTLGLSYLPFTALIGFVPLPPMALAAVLAIVLVYVAASEFLKSRIGVLRLHPHRDAGLPAPVRTRPATGPR
ncbi:MAG: magnesium-translocating P-type ATPase [Devosia nanyangense]|uniref:Magnesium-transporting ATPase, P-type 1 n=1 Tax=Devosia nanyangense TaxID=1228055 RepID=A0A933L5L3_9HYPH|nr:magnesium-translocating P-type ATPase [Devosia nanyangense]